MIKMFLVIFTPRFAEFVEGDSWHVTNEELLEYDSGPDPTPPHLISDDEEEEEMDFILSSQWWILTCFRGSPWHF